MSDITCAKCGEPWEAYYVYHEMEEWEREKFLKGQGCPSCKFGEKAIGSLKSEDQFRVTALESTDDPDALFDRW